MTKLPDINTGISKPDLFVKFKAQLKKDFENCGFEGEFTERLVSDFNLILAAVTAEVEKINRTSSGKLNELLYRIDISEMQIKKAVNLNPETDLNKIIAELIIKRELQKIVIKEHFKNQ